MVNTVVETMKENHTAKNQRSKTDDSIQHNLLNNALTEIIFVISKGAFRQLNRLWIIVYCSSITVCYIYKWF